LPTAKLAVHAVVQPRSGGRARPAIDHVAEDGAVPDVERRWAAIGSEMLRSSRPARSLVEPKNDEPSSIDFPMVYEPSK